MTGAATRVVLALGANLGDREAHLRGAIDDLAAGGVEVDAVSSVWETVAVRPDGPDPDAPAYLNLVLLGRSALEPAALLALANRIEADHGRVRAERWGDRPLDIDIVDVDGVRSEDPALTLPHPRAAERDFVLGPWLEVDPGATLAGHGRVADLLAALGGA